MATICTYQSLQTQTLITFSFQALTENFKIIDSFIKNFPTFQRKLADLEKVQKATAQDLSNFKISTQNTFATLNDMVETRANTTKGSSLADAEQIKEIKKSFKQVKTFITENTRDQHQAQEVRDKEAEEGRKKLQEQIKLLKKQLEEQAYNIRSLEQEARSIKAKHATKTELQALNKNVMEQTEQLQKTTTKATEIQEMLEGLNVKDMKEQIDSFQKDISEEFEQMKRKFKLKADYSDVIKLEDMLLNIINFSYETSTKKFADKGETKKALIFLQKKLNRLMQNLYGDEDGERQGLLVTKGFKCISCTKDLGEMEGKLDKYKAWSVFPAKDPHIKDRYSGFGAGFQTIVETTVNKKGGDVSYDEKGRMTAPYNLTREVQGSLLKPSQSQSKLGKQASVGKYQSTGSKQGSPNKPPQLETNYMVSFGRNNDADIDLKAEYMQKQRGLMTYIKYIIDGKKTE